MTRFGISIAILLIASAAVYNLLGVQDTPYRKTLSAFPKEIGQWRLVRSGSLSTEIQKVLKVDDYLMRSYVDARGNKIALFIGYFNTQREGKQIHSPRLCLTGSGWQDVSHNTLTLEASTNRKDKASINYRLMQKGDRRELFLWWYQCRGRIYASEYVNKAYLIVDSVVKNRSDGALVRLNMKVSSSTEQALNMQLEFVDLIREILDEYVPP